MRFTKALPVWLTVSLLTTFLFLLPQSASATTGGGNGICTTSSFVSGTGTTSTSPFLISTVDQLKEMGDCESQTRYFALANSIDLGGFSAPWTPIGPDEGSSFQGHLDGKGFSITGLYVEPKSFSGLFGFIEENSSVKNLAIDAATVSGETVGILAGQTADKIILENLTVSGTVISNGAGTLDQSPVAGGLVGALAWYGTENRSLTTVSNVAFTGSIFGKAGVESAIGGLFGYAGSSLRFPNTENRTLIQSAYVKANIVTQNSGAYIGGIVGEGTNLTVRASKVNISLTDYGGSQIGGAVSWATSSILDQVAVFGNIYLATDSAKVGGLVNTLRHDTSTTSNLSPSISKSLVNLRVQSKSNSNFFGGIVYNHINGTVDKNIGLSVVSGFSSQNLGGTRLLSTSATTGAAKVLSNNIFDNTGTGITVGSQGPTPSAGESIGISTSSISELATLTSRYADANTIWGVDGSPYLLSVTASAPPQDPQANVVTNGGAVEIFAGSPLMDVALDANDFSVTADGSPVSITGASVTQSQRVVRLELATSISASAQVIVGHVSSASSPTYLYPASQNQLPSFTVTAINQVAYSTPLPNASSLTPVRVAQYESTLVTVTGQNLREASVGLRPPVGGIGSAQIVEASDTSVTFIAPNLVKLSRSSTSELAYSVRISTPGGSSTMVGALIYAGNPAISTLSPTIGGRGTEVTIRGLNLSSATSVSFNSNVVSVLAASSTSVTAIAPAGTAGTTVNVAVQGPGWSSTLSASFRYTQSPSISALSTNSGLISGGDSVTITGVTFSGLISVKFGSAPAVIVSSSSAQITITTPQVQNPGQVDVSVITTGGSSILSGGFTYFSPPSSNNSSTNSSTVSQSVASNSSGGSSGNGGASAGSNGPLGPIIGTLSARIFTQSGTALVISGTGLSGATSVLIGSTSFIVQANTDTSVTIVITDLPAGTWDLLLSTPNGEAKLPNAITFIAPVSLESPGQLMGYKWTKKFSGNSRMLTSQQRNALIDTSRVFESAKTLICWGYTTAKQPSEWAIRHARSRAQAACNEVATLLRARILIRVKYGAEKSFAMRAAIQFWK